MTEDTATVWLLWKIFLHISQVLFRKSHTPPQAKLLSGSIYIWGKFRSFENLTNLVAVSLAVILPLLTTFIISSHKPRIVPLFFWKPKGIKEKLLISRKRCLRFFFWACIRVLHVQFVLVTYYDYVYEWQGSTWQIGDHHQIAHFPVVQLYSRPHYVLCR